MYKPKAITLLSVQQKLVETWGRLAYAWGVPPTMAQIFALLYVYPEPLDSDTILVTLQISRGNVSINLRKLLEWELIHKIDMPGTKRAFYTAERDIWVIAANIIRNRFEREIGPIRQLLDKIEQEPQAAQDSHLRESLREIRQVVELLTRVTEFALPILMTADRLRVEKILDNWQRRRPKDGRGSL